MLISIFRLISVFHPSKIISYIESLKFQLYSNIICSVCIFFFCSVILLKTYVISSEYGKCLKKIRRMPLNVSCSKQSLMIFLFVGRKSGFNLPKMEKFWAIWMFERNEFDFYLRMALTINQPFHVKLTSNGFWWAIPKQKDCIFLFHVKYRNSLLLIFEILGIWNQWHSANDIQLKFHFDYSKYLFCVLIIWMLEIHEHRNGNWHSMCTILWNFDWNDISTCRRNQRQFTEVWTWRKNLLRTYFAPQRILNSVLRDSMVQGMEFNGTIPIVVSDGNFPKTVTFLIDFLHISIFCYW